MHRLWSILFAIVNLAALGLFVVAPSYGWWLPKDVSTTGAGVDFLFYLILYITGFFFVLTEAILVYCMWAYAHEDGRKATYIHGNHNLEIFWTTVTSIILLIVAFWQVPAWATIKFRNYEQPPDHVVEISARQFEWRIRYPTPETLEQIRSTNSPTVLRKWSEEGRLDDIRVVNDLHIWAGQKQADDTYAGGQVRVMLKTRDVLHSFFLPNMRIKQDAVPGKTIPVWFQATEHNVEWVPETKTWRFRTDEEGRSMEYPIACAELCGWGHYKMQGRLWIHRNKAEYDIWLKQEQAAQSKRLP